MSILGLQVPKNSHLGEAFRAQNSKFADRRSQDRDHQILRFFLSGDRRSCRDCQKKIADRDQKTGDRSCLDVMTHENEAFTTDLPISMFISSGGE